jgi:hypothetical protein
MEEEFDESIEEMWDRNADDDREEDADESIEEREFLRSWFSSRFTIAKDLSSVRNSETR